MRIVLPPVQWPLLSTKLAERRISRQAEKSPWRSPTATTRCKGAAATGTARTTTVASQARRDQRLRKCIPFLILSPPESVVQLPVVVQALPTTSMRPCHRHVEDHDHPACGKASAWQS